MQAQHQSSIIMTDYLVASSLVPSIDGVVAVLVERNLLCNAHECLKPCMQAIFVCSSGCPCCLQYWGPPGCTINEVDTLDVLRLVKLPCLLQ